MPDFSLARLGGGTVRLSDFKGKVVLLDFWATYCGPCHDAIPAFERLHREHRSRGLEVVGVSMDTYVEHVPDFVKRSAMTYTVALDPENSSHALYGVRSLPTTLLVGRDGSLRGRWTGFDGTVFREMREAALGLLEEGDGRP